MIAHSSKTVAIDRGVMENARQFLRCLVPAGEGCSIVPVGEKGQSRSSEDVWESWDSGPKGAVTLDRFTRSISWGINTIPRLGIRSASIGSPSAGPYAVYGISSKISEGIPPRTHESSTLWIDSDPLNRNRSISWGCYVTHHMVIAGNSSDLVDSSWLGPCL